MNLLTIFSRRFEVLALVLAASWLLAGCSSTQNDPLFTSAPQPPSAAVTGAATPADAASAMPPVDPNVARFHVNDTVIVTLSGLPDPVTPYEEPIKEDGTISLPFIGRVVATGKTAGELQAEILRLYVPKYYTDHLNVTVKSAQDRVYYVGGEVRSPNRYVYAGATTVTKAIQSAGDFTDFASKSNVILIRANGQRIKVNCNKAIDDPSKDPQVYPGDQILVKKRIF